MPAKAPAACPMPGAAKSGHQIFGSMKCTPCEGGTPPMSAAAIRQGLKQVPDWKFAHGAIRKTFKFKNYYETMAFVNAIAFISHREDHHPDLAVYYNKCEVSYHTHAIHGISANDFICAAKIEKLTTV